MGHPIDDHYDVQTTAEELIATRAELRNAKALAEKLQALLDSKTHQVEALHKEVDNLALQLKNANNNARRWHERAEEAERDPEPDLDTVPLQALLEAAGTFLEHGQAVAIHGSYDPTTHVDIHALGRVFRVETSEASEMLTHAHELAQCEVVRSGK